MDKPTKQVLVRQKNMLRYRPAPGAKPGTFKKPPNSAPTKVVLSVYDDKTLQSEVIHAAHEIAPYLTENKVIWVNVVGLDNLDLIKEIAQVFSLHPLALEDVVHVYQRPKVEDFDNCKFIIARLEKTEPLVKNEQISFFLGKNFVLSFMETESDFFEKIALRFHNEHSHLRQAGADYLLYELLDATVDSYFPLLQIYGEAIDMLEDDIVAKPDNTVITKIHNIKQNMVNLKRNAWSQRSALGEIYRAQDEFILNKTLIYFRDCYDHSVQIVDLIENYLDRSTSLIDIYLSSSSQKLNEIMKVLTIIATIFMPLSFLASLWGMNFNTAISNWNMPELNWRYGYPFALSIMLIITMMLLWLFYRLGWLSLKNTKKKTRK